MGVFDYIQLEEPWKCEKCGTVYEYLQTKYFFPYINTYRVGDSVREVWEGGDGPGVLPEFIYCCGEDKKFWIVIVDGKIVAVTDSRQRLREVVCEKF